MDYPDEKGYVEDDYRIEYLKQHIRAMMDAVELDGVKLLGYTSWGCIDLVSASTGCLLYTSGLLASVGGSGDNGRSV